MAELAATSLLPGAVPRPRARPVGAARGRNADESRRASHGRFLRRHSAPNFITLVVVGIGVFSGLVPGSGSAALTLVPALITALGAILVGLGPEAAAGERGTRADTDRWRGRVNGAVHRSLAAVADGVEQAIALLRSHSLGVMVGSFAYLAFDIAAVGSVPSLGTLVLGYLIGQLGNLIPLLGGVGAPTGR